MYQRRSPDIPLSQFFLGAMGACALFLVPTHAIAQETQASTINQNFRAMEMGLEQDFESYFGEDLGEVTQTSEDAAQTLENLATLSGSRAGVIWVIPREDELHLVLLLPGGRPIVRDLKSVPRDRLLETVRVFQTEMSDPSLDPSQSKSAQQLYQWIIGTFEAEHLADANLDSLLFCLGNGLRGLPIAALQNNRGQYLVEHYSVTSIPAFNLIDTRYNPLKFGQFLAAGASQFAELSPLPAVPLELQMIQAQLRNPRRASQPWRGRSLLNQSFTLNQLKTEFAQTPFNIVHLATHAEFRPGHPNQSFIQLQDQRLQLGEMNQIQWPQNLDLLVLSACQTAVGDSRAELGFAGIALKAQIKSVVGSLWQVSDFGTLALMNEFYRRLPTTSTKAIALQQAQLSLLNGTTQIQIPETQRGQPSLPDTTPLSQPPNFSHPYFWAGFTLLSSPW